MHKNLKALGLVLLLFLAWGLILSAEVPISPEEQNLAPGPSPRPLEQTASTTPSLSRSPGTQLRGTLTSSSLRPGWLKYTSPDRNLNIEIPDTWAVADTTSNPHYNICGGCIYLRPNNQWPAITIYPPDSPRIDGFLRRASETIESYSLTSFNGNQAYVHDNAYSDWEESGFSKIRMLLFPAPEPSGTFYIILAEDEVPGVVSYREQIDEILNTIELNWEES